MAARIYKRDDRCLNISGTGHIAGIRPDLARTLEWRAMDSELSSTARHIIHVIAKVMARDGSRCNPSLRWIASMCGLSPTTVKKYLSEIEAWAEIEVIKGQGRAANTYKPSFGYQSAIKEYRDNYHRPEPADDDCGSPLGSRNWSYGSTPDPIGSCETTVDPQPSDPQCVMGQQAAIMGQIGSVVGQQLAPTNNTRVTISGSANKSQKNGTMGGGEGSGQQQDGFDNNGALTAALIPFGDALELIVTDLIAWDGIDIPGMDDADAHGKIRDMMADLTGKVCLYGAANVIEAWQTTRVSAKGNPKAYFAKVLSNLLNHHGKRDIPDTSQRHLTPREACLLRHGREGL